MKIKICGLFRPEDIEYANRVRPDFIGFVFWEKSRRRVTAEQAAALREKLDTEIQTVGVFVDAPCEEIISLLEAGIIDIAQLHGEESEEDIRYIQAVTHKPVIKAVKVKERYDVEAWLDSGADWLLFDSGMGSGIAFDRQLLAGVEREYFLAGGLSPEAIRELPEHICPYAVDMSSGVETDGVKNFEKMRAAVEAARNRRQL
ncbi:MAG: phosphoribosylanthranilate isomerase [Butyrivibrio sp.]|nr:phosphoribosylanthranilate isomerase [Acetatifactor muris]MCM1558482.1 phosphoribosylanthranilate isomerase [Butyrivibrio sp.]